MKDETKFLIEVASRLDVSLAEAADLAMHDYPNNNQGNPTYHNLAKARARLRLTEANYLIKFAEQLMTSDEEGES